MERGYMPTREERTASFYKVLPGIKVFDYNPQDVIRDVSLYFKIDEKMIRTRSRERWIAQPRQVAMYFIQEIFPGITLNEIGQMFGGHNHATVIHARKVVSNLNDTNRKFCYQLKELKEIIKSHILEKSPEKKLDNE